MFLFVKIFPFLRNTASVSRTVSWHVVLFFPCTNWDKEKSRVMPNLRVGWVTPMWNNFLGVSSLFYWEQRAVIHFKVNRFTSASFFVFWICHPLHFRKRGTILLFFTLKRLKRGTSLQKRDSWQVCYRCRQIKLDKKLMVFIRS